MKLLELTCSGCEKPFLVKLASNENCICPSCHAFKLAMENMMHAHVAAPKKMNPLYKGALWGLGLVSPLWIAFVILYLRSR